VCVVNIIMNKYFSRCMHVSIKHASHKNTVSIVDKMGADHDKEVLK